MQRTLKTSPEQFTKMLSGLIASGVTFEATEEKEVITIDFTGGY